MREGRLGYNSYNKRYGLLSSDLWIDPGSVGKDTNGNESGERMVFGWNTILWRFGVCTGKDTGIKQTGRVIVGLLLVKK